MIVSRRSCLGSLCALTLVLLLLVSTGLPVSATRGGPGSAELGIGGSVLLSDDHLIESISLAKSMELDWVTLELDWSAIQPDPGNPIDWRLIDHAVDELAAGGIGIMVALSRPPNWVLNGVGPDAGLSASFLSDLWARHPAQIQAVELFPRPNTRDGWGDAPNPAQYVDVYRAVLSRMSGNATSPILIAGGLETNISPDDGPDAMPAVQYLQSMYQAADPDFNPIIGLRYGAVSGQPLDFPHLESNTVLRQYERIRRVMSAAGRTGGKIWITSLKFADAPSPEQQAAWLEEAYPLVRSQLYIGSVFFLRVSPCQKNNTQTCPEFSLFPNDSTIISTSKIQKLVDQIRKSGSPANSGRMKTDLLKKPR